MENTNHSLRGVIAFCVVLSAVSMSWGAALADGIARSCFKITGIPLSAYDGFGSSVCSPGDLDGDGVDDLAVGALYDDDGGYSRGAVWVLFMEPGGAVKAYQKISNTQGSFSGVLDNQDYFGCSVCSLGDVDGDGVGDLAVGAMGDDDGGSARGAAWVLFLNSNGTVKAYQKMSDTQGGFTGVLINGDYFGSSVCSAGDLDDDGVGDLVVGAYRDDDGGYDRGAVWVLFMNSDGTVRTHQKISDTQGGFTGALSTSDSFGSSVCSPGDLDGDGVEDLVVGAPYDDDGGSDRGAVWALFLHSDGTVRANQKISTIQGGFTGLLDNNDRFGWSVGSLGGASGYQSGALAVGAPYDDDGGGDRGAIWVLFVNGDGTVAEHSKISASEGGFAGALADSDCFGSSVCAIDDWDGDGIRDLAVGAQGDDQGGTESGAAWGLFLNDVPSCSLSKTHIDFGFIYVNTSRDTSFTILAEADQMLEGIVSESCDQFSVVSGGGPYSLADGESLTVVVRFEPTMPGAHTCVVETGASICSDVSLTGSTVVEVAVAAHQKISDTEGNFAGILDDADHFARSACSLGDLDGDGVEDLAIGVNGDDDGGTDRGAVWVLFQSPDGRVKTCHKISSLEGGFVGPLDNADGFGISTCSPGDLDGDGVLDLAVGAHLDDDGGSARGAIWVLFLNPDGTVKAQQKISDTQGGFAGVLDNGDYFGCSMCGLGDLDGDGAGDIAVGAPYDDDGWRDGGAVWVLFLNSDGTVKTHQKLSDTEGGFAGVLSEDDNFGWSVCLAGDLDSDGVRDLAVGAPYDNDGGPQRGSVWLLLMNSDGTVRAHQKISATHGGFTGLLHNYDHFGWSVCSLGDLEGDGVPDLAVGATGDDDGGIDRGAVWLLFMTSSCTVRASQKISSIEGEFGGVLDNGDCFGGSVCSVGDLTGDGTEDLAVGAYGDDDGGTDCGAVWVLFFGDEPPWSPCLISDFDVDFGGVYRNTSRDTTFVIRNMGEGVLAGGVTESCEMFSILSGAGPYSLSAGESLTVVVRFQPTESGVYQCVIETGTMLCSDVILAGHTLAEPSVASQQKISDIEGGFTGILDDADNFGHAACSLGDLDGDGITDLAVGAYRDDDGGPSRGAVWVLFSNDDGTVRAHQKISGTQGGFGGGLDDNDRFGNSVCCPGDIDNDGVEDLAVGAYLDDDGGSARGAIWLLFLNSDGTVRFHSKISDTQGGFTGVLDDGDYFGWSVGSIGDLDGDGVEDLVVGAPYDDDGGSNRGAVWLLFLNSDGTVRDHKKISATKGGFMGVLQNGNCFGSSVCSPGDLDLDGVEDMAVGAPYDDDGGSGRGAVWVLFLNSNGTVRTNQKISDTQGGFTGTLDNDDYFGWSVCSAGDLDADGVADLAAGTYFDDDGGTARGAVWLLFMGPDGTVWTGRKISAAEGGFTGYLDDNDCFGSSVCSVGDLDGDGVGDLAVGAEGDDDGGTDRGAIWVLLLREEASAWVSEEPVAVPAHLQCLPNPFRRAMQVTFGVEREGSVTLCIYDVRGRLVRTLIDRRLVPGAYSQEWAGTNSRGAAVPSGIYFCRLVTGDKTFATKIMLVK